VFELPGDPRRFSRLPALYDVAPDGERFLMPKRIEKDTEEAEARPDVLVVQNWFEEFRKKK
jgi:hypothetical protein